MQRCALALPGGPWHFSFAWGQLENLSFFHRNHVLGTQGFTGSELWAPFSFSWSTALKLMGLHGNLTQ